MLWLEHILLTRFIFGSWTMYSILPDVPMVLMHFMINGEWSKYETSLYTDVIYRVPHSVFIPLLMMLFGNTNWKPYLGHILMDVVAHTGIWAVRPFFPFSNFAIQGFYDPWKIFSR